MGGGGDERRAGRQRAAVQLAGEEQVGQLAVAVGPLGPVRRLRVAVEHARVAAVVGDRGDRDHARRGGGEQRRQQPCGERDVAEVVGAVLELEAVLGLAVARRRHDAALLTSRSSGPSQRSANSRTDAWEARSSRSDAGGPGHRRGGPPAGLDVAAGQHDRGAVGGELPGGVHADPGVGPGHDDGASGQVGQGGGRPAHGAPGMWVRVGVGRARADASAQSGTQQRPYVCPSDHCRAVGHS